jgi:hypothetical protein
MDQVHVGLRHHTVVDIIISTSRIERDIVGDTVVEDFVVDSVVAGEDRDKDVGGSNLAAWRRGA